MISTSYVDTMCNCTVLDDEQAWAANTICQHKLCFSAYSRTTNSIDSTCQCRKGKKRVTLLQLSGIERQNDTDREANRL